MLSSKGDKKDSKLLEVKTLKEKIVKIMHMIKSGKAWNFIYKVKIFFNNFLIYFFKFLLLYFIYYLRFSLKYIR